MNKLEFIIAGVQKGGTTAMKSYLSQHPDVFMPMFEVQYFNKTRNYVKGLDWYLNQFKNYNQEKIIGEKTPNYMDNSIVAKRIYKVFPNVKLIFLLRINAKKGYPSLNNNIKSYLQAYYRQSISNLEKMLGVDLKQLWESCIE